MNGEKGSTKTGKTDVRMNEGNKVKPKIHTEKKCNEKEITHIPRKIN